MTLPEIVLVLAAAIGSACGAIALSGRQQEPRPAPPAPPDAGGAEDDAARQDFRRTLTETFARLPVGLAIFDGSGRLSTFNPALGDLTGLPPGFLAARPHLRDLLDRLREMRVLPEPRNWSAWRDGVSRLEEGAREGRLLQNWDLPDGRSWRVSGRPHPGGSIVYLFEDVTDSVASIRRLRAELELGQAVVDSLSEGVAIFSPQGVLTLANAAYAQIWGVDPNRTLGHIGLAEARTGWRAEGDGGGGWDQLDEALRPVGAARRPWRGRVRLRDGRAIGVRTVPLGGGGLMMRFAPQERPPVRPRAEPALVAE
ncbi:MAG: PAS-domain containing protein [Hasllibacter sp.]